MYASKVLAALAVVAVASAATATSTASVCSQATATISSQADASSLSSCTTFTGDIEVASTLSGSLALDGIQQIEGSLNVTGASLLTSLSAGSLNSISDVMTLQGLTTLSTLSFPTLKTIGTIMWITLPALQKLSFTDVVNTCSSVTIEDTQLASLDGINLDTVATMIINNNRFLETISTQIANITDSLDIDTNGENLNIEFPNLITAGNMTFRNASTISMPSLANVTGNLNFIENFFANITAPNLTSVGNVLAITANPSLNNITFDALTTAGGLKIANNTDLIKIDGFTSLKTVTGGFDVTGNFTEAPFAALTRVDGSFNMQTSGNFTGCSKFLALKGTDFLGTVTCTENSDNVQTGTSSGSGTSTSSGSSSTSTKKSDAGHLNAPMALGVFGGFLAMLL